MINSRGKEVNLSGQGDDIIAGSNKVKAEATIIHANIISIDILKVNVTGDNSGTAPFAEPTQQFKPVDEKEVRGAVNTNVEEQSLFRSGKTGKTITNKTAEQRLKKLRKDKKATESANTKKTKIKTNEEPEINSTSSNDEKKQLTAPEIQLAEVFKRILNGEPTGYNSGAKEEGISAHVLWHLKSGLTTDRVMEILGYTVVELRSQIAESNDMSNRAMQLAERAKQLTETIQKEIKDANKDDSEGGESYMANTNKEKGPIIFGTRGPKNGPVGSPRPAVFPRTDLTGTPDCPPKKKPFLSAGCLAGLLGLIIAAAAIGGAVIYQANHDEPKPAISAPVKGTETPSGAAAVPPPVIETPSPTAVAPTATGKAEVNAALSNADLTIYGLDSAGNGQDVTIKPENGNYMIVDLWFPWLSPEKTEYSLVIKDGTSFVATGAAGASWTFEEGYDASEVLSQANQHVADRHSRDGITIIKVSLAELQGLFPGNITQ